MGRVWVVQWLDFHMPEIRGVLQSDYVFSLHVGKRVGRLTFSPSQANEPNSPIILKASTI